MNDMMVERCEEDLRRVLEDLNESILYAEPSAGGELLQRLL